MRAEIASDGSAFAAFWPQQGSLFFYDVWSSGGPSSAGELLAVRQQTPHGRNQPIELDRLGIELVAAGGERLFPGSAERVRRERDDRDVARLRVGLEPPPRPPPGARATLQTQEAAAGRLGKRHAAPLPPVLRHPAPVTVQQLEPHLEHVDVVVVVLDVEHFGHDAASISLPT